jgi:predicted nuclease of restriction endonuclease-like (RecB) superfamily
VGPSNTRTENLIAGKLNFVGFKKNYILFNEPYLTAGNLQKFVLELQFV